jgi:predicted nucleic acid-binding protein
MVGEAIEKRLITSKNPVQKLKQNPEIIKKLSTYSHDVQKIEEMNINILDLSLEIIQESAKIRNKEGLLTNDSLMAAIMKQYNIDRLITNDDDFDNIEWINVYKPSDI